jgi:8-oxo-dGTP diphosphatase
MTRRPSPDQELAMEANAASIAVFRGGSVLLVKRGRAPYVGLWSLPGGKIEPEEPPREAVSRELKEETAIEADVAGVLDTIFVAAEGAGGEEMRYRLTVFYGTYREGSLAAGGDADAAQWFGLDEIDDLPMTEGTAALVWLGAHRLRTALNG